MRKEFVDLLLGLINIDYTCTIFVLIDENENSAYTTLLKNWVYLPSSVLSSVY